MKEEYKTQMEDIIDERFIDKSEKVKKFIIDYTLFFMDKLIILNPSLGDIGNDNETLNYMLDILSRLDLDDIELEICEGLPSIEIFENLYGVNEPSNLDDHIKIIINKFVEYLNKNIKTHKTLKINMLISSIQFINEISKDNDWPARISIISRIKFI